MTKVYCADTSCEFLNDKGVCTLKKIGLAWMSVHTVNDGRQEFNKCRMYQKSQRAIEIEEFFAKCIQESCQKYEGGLHNGADL